MNLRSVSETHQTTCSSRQNIYKLSVEVIRRGESKRKSAHGSTSSVRCGKSSSSESYMCFCFFKLIFCVLLSVKNTQNVSTFQSSRVISFNCRGAVGAEIRLHVSSLIDSSLRDVLNVGAENVSFLITSTADDVLNLITRSFKKLLTTSRRLCWIVAMSRMNSQCQLSYQRGQEALEFLKEKDILVLGWFDQQQMFLQWLLD